MAKDNRAKNISVVTNDFMASNGEHFYIVTFTVDSEYLTGRMYGAINYRDVEANGRIKRQMNGYELYMKKTVAEVIKEVEYRVKIDETAKAEGISKMAAILWLCDGNKYTKEQCVEMAKQLESLSK